MIVHFLGQPGQQFGTLLTKQFERASAGEFSKIHIVSAFAKNAGVARIAPALTKASAQKGNSVVAYLGIDHDGTSREAVALLQTICTDVFIIHSTRMDVTFHPKVYFFEGSKHAAALVGSSNLTAGGLYTNLEAGIFFDELAPSDSITKDLKAYIGTLCDLSKPHIKQITTANLAEMLSALPPEATLWKPSSTGKVTKAGPTAGTTLFGAGVFPSAPPLPAGTSKAAPAPAPASTPATTATPAAATGLKPPIGSIFGFWKKLSNSDVSASSSPGQIIIPKEFGKLFPPLGTKSKTPSGGFQSDVNFPVRFLGLGMNKILPNARLILYEPAPHHPRPNVEHRFTFLDKSINPDGLASGDVLVFQVLTNDPNNCWFNVYYVKQADLEYQTIRASSSGKFGALYP